MSNRKAFVKTFLEGLGAILPGSDNTEFYKRYLEGLSDEAFETMVTMIENDQIVLPIWVPNLKDSKLDLDRNLKVALEWGHDFFQQLWLTDPKNPELTYLTPKKYPVIQLPMRRQAQTLEKKMSVPMHNDAIDDLTGQVVGESKGSGLTYPELQVLYSEGLEKTILEFIKLRGGDTDSYHQLDRKIVETGGATIDEISVPGSRAKATDTLSTLLKAAHLGNNL